MKVNVTDVHTVPHKDQFLNLLCVLCVSIAVASCGGSNNTTGTDNGSAAGTDGGMTPGSITDVPASTDGGSVTGGVTTSDGSTEGGGSSGDMSIDPAALVTAAEFSDEFLTDSLSNWTLRHQTEGEIAQYTVLDINQTNPGMLTVAPTLTPGWFANGKAPLIYKRVTGNFSVETSVTTQSAANSSLPPGSDFNSAGLMARVAGDSGENYLMVNVGRQNSSIENSLGSEAKNTTNSNSVLDLQAGSNNGRLTLCRFGNDFLAYRLLDNDTEWTQISITVTRNDFPQITQVGMVVNGFSGPDVLATFDYIRMRVPTSVADCTTDR